MQLEDRLFSTPQEGSSPRDSTEIEKRYPKEETEKTINQLTRMYNKRLERLDHTNSYDSEEGFA